MWKGRQDVCEVRSIVSDRSAVYDNNKKGWGRWGVYSSGEGKGGTSELREGRSCAAVQAKGLFHRRNGVWGIIPLSQWTWSATGSSPRTYSRSIR